MNQNTKKPAVVMIVENSFPFDSRVRKEAYALKDDYHVTVISLKSSKSQFKETVNGVDVIRIPDLELDKIHFKQPWLQGLWKKLSYALTYLYFTSAATIVFLVTALTRHYRVIHVHNPPDTLFVVGLIGKLFSIRFIYDHHDLSPELFQTRFSSKKGLAYKTLVFFERMSCRIANAVICTNESYKKIETERHGIDPAKIFVVRNNPIISDCASPVSEGVIKTATEKKILLFLGCINPQDGVDTLLQAIKHLVNDLGERNFICRIVGGGDSLESLKVLARQLNIADYVEFKGQESNRQKVIEYLSTADVGVEPAPPNPLNMHSTFIKIMEYMAAAKPIVAFDLPENRYSAGGSALLTPLDDILGFATRIKQLLDNAPLRQELGEKGRRRVVEELSWDNAATELKRAYQSLKLDAS